MARIPAMMISTPLLNDSSVYAASAVSIHVQPSGSGCSGLALSSISSAEMKPPRKASILEELGEAAGIDGEALAQTVADYNAGFEAGKDERFGRDLTGTIPFTGTRYFAFTSNSNVLATVGGLTIDGNCSVLDCNDMPIPGLFACGNASGNFFSGNYPRHIPGTSIGRAVTFGYVAAESAVNGTIDEGPIVEGNAPSLTTYGTGEAVDEATVQAAVELGSWNPYDSVHGGSASYSPERLAGNVTACDNCHTYRAGDTTVADNMVME